MKDIAVDLKAEFTKFAPTRGVQGFKTVVCCGGGSCCGGSLRIDTLKAGRIVQPGDK